MLHKLLKPFLSGNRSAIPLSLVPCTLLFTEPAYLQLLAPSLTQTTFHEFYDTHNNSFSAPIETSDRASTILS